MPDALIIGGGISGLACAIALKRADWTVEVFDAGQPIADPTSAEELDSQARYRGKGVVFVIRFRCGWQSVGAIATELKLPELLASNGNPVKASPSRRKPVASPLLQNVQF